MKTLDQLWHEQDGPAQADSGAGEASGVDFTTRVLWSAVAALGSIAAILVVPVAIRPCGIRGGQEAGAVGGLLSLYVAQSIYRESGKNVVGGVAQYADSLAELSATGTDLIDDVLGRGRKGCYEFRVRAHPDGYSWDAEAHSTCTGCGTRRFYTNQSGVIWFSTESADWPAPLNAGVGEIPAGFRALGG